MQKLYTDKCPDCGGYHIRLGLSSEENKSLKKSFAKAVRHIFKNKSETLHPDVLKEKAIKPLLNNIESVIKQGFDKGVTQSVPKEMLSDLTDNVHLFSGVKTYDELHQLSNMLLDENGTIKPFSTYWQDVQAIHETYNQSYLESEYIFATQSAQMAAKWAEVEADGDAYDLQYRTAGDDRVRDEHAALEDITLPPSDPFWEDFYPPNGWRCRCTAVQVRIGKYDRSDSEEATNKGEEATTGSNEIFRFNPGKDGVVFPPHHPYFKEYKNQLSDIKDAIE